MKTLHVMVSAAAMTLAMAGPAGAVDLWDTTISGEGPMWDNDLTIIENGQERHIVLMNGDMLRDACSECTIKVKDGNTVQASGNDLVEVRGSSLTVRHAPNASAASPRENQEAELRSPATSTPSMTADEDAEKVGTPDHDALADPFDGPEGGED